MAGIILRGRGFSCSNVCVEWHAIILRAPKIDENCIQISPTSSFQMQKGLVKPCNLDTLLDEEQKYVHVRSQGWPSIAPVRPFVIITALIFFLNLHFVILTKMAGIILSRGFKVASYGTCGS